MHKFSKRIAGVKVRATKKGTARPETGEVYVSEFVLTDREKEVFRAVQLDPEAKKSFAFLLRKTGVTAAELIINFVVEAWAPTLPDPFGTVEQWNDLRSLGTRLEKLARRVKQANELPTWNFKVPRLDLCDIRDRKRLASYFEKLPELMLAYARNIDLKIETIQALRKSHRRHRGKALQLTFSESLVRWIKSKTGHRYGDHVAAVQRIAYQKANRSLLPASGDTLRKRELRNRKP